MDRELLCEYFLTFSRFEYSLKAIGLFKRPKSKGINRFKENGCLPDAEPDWDSFAASLQDVFQTDRTEALKQACYCILDSPPFKQVIINNDDSLAWETPVRAASDSEIAFLLTMVRRIRNNLFHGGKYNIEVHEDTERTAMFLISSLVILEECLYLNTELKLVFDEAVI